MKKVVKILCIALLVVGVFRLFLGIENPVSVRGALQKASETELIYHPFEFVDSANSLKYSFLNVYNTFTTPLDSDVSMYSIRYFAGAGPGGSVYVGKVPNADGETLHISRYTYPRHNASGWDVLTTTLGTLWDSITGIVAFVWNLFLDGVNLLFNCGSFFYYLIAE